MNLSAFQSPTAFGGAPFTQGGLYLLAIYHICHSEEALADEESVLLRGFLFIRSCSLSQILRCAQDDTPCRFLKTANRVILRRATPDEESVASAGLSVFRNSLASPSGGGGRAERPDGEGAAVPRLTPQSRFARQLPWKGSQALARPFVGLSAFLQPLSLTDPSLRSG